MLSWRLGFRSLLRHKRRSIITALGIALSLAMMIFFVGISENSHNQMADMGIRLGAGHVLIQGKGYQDQQTLDYLVAKPESILQMAKQLPGYRGATSRIRASGLLSAGELSAAIMLGGVDPLVEPKLSNIAAGKNRRTGNYLRSRAQLPFKNQPADIYLGKDLAETLEVVAGDRVVLTVSPVGASRPAAAAFVVRGTFQTGLSTLDGGYAEIALPEAQKLLALGSKVTQVAVLLDDMNRSDAASAALTASLGPGGELEVLSWKQALRELYEAIALDDASLYIMMGIIFIIVAIGIFNTMLMSVTERTRELGVMMALGTPRRLIFSSIMAESVVLSLLSALFGLVLGLLGHMLVSQYGIDVAAMVDGKMEFAGIAFSGKIYSTLSAAVVCKWTLTVIGLVVGSALVPALRATRLEPLEAMRHV
jgi:ABC-type lipoprotein release transport system permease subunit